MEFSVEKIIVYKEKAVSLGIKLADKQLSLFKLYADYLAEKNKSLNLTAVEPEAYFDQLFLDSLLAVKTGLFHSGMKVIDIGSGAGFPALPLKIYYPEVKFWLVEARAKKVEFLRQVVALLGLKGVTVINERAENLAHQPDYREKFDLATARAVAPLPVLLEYCLPFVRLNGFLLAYKGPKVEEELKLAGKALNILGGVVVAREQALIEGKERFLVVINKVKQTPREFPRKAGIPKKRPL